MGKVDQSLQEFDGLIREFQLKEYAAYTSLDSRIDALQETTSASLDYLRDKMGDGAQVLEVISGDVRTLQGSYEEVVGLVETLPREFHEQVVRLLGHPVVPTRSQGPG